MFFFVFFLVPIEVATTRAATRWFMAYGKVHYLLKYLFLMLVMFHAK